MRVQPLFFRVYSVAMAATSYHRDEICALGINELECVCTGLPFS